MITVTDTFQINIHSDGGIAIWRGNHLLKGLDKTLALIDILKAWEQYSKAIKVGPSGP